ncbi:MAG TPA: metal ABC transporter substrate-binding protein, partial [Clostridiaceae bacterium]|nr:metal ABC transporter substrate-binding protein [Clostridiaceae bacterium]
MKRRVLSIVIAVMLCLTLVAGCGAKKDDKILRVGM